MGQITVEKDVDGIDGLCVITPLLHGDARGYFMETFNLRELEEAGIFAEFVQDNQAGSSKGVLRGMHFQKEHPQTKLVRAIKGTVYDVCVDLRPSSKSFGRWHGELLSAENNKQFLIPKGFAHGYIVLSDEAEFCYKCDDYYHPEDEGGVRFDDPDIGIVWPGLNKRMNEDGTGDYMLEDGTKLRLADRDLCWPSLSEIRKGLGL